MIKNEPEGELWVQPNTRSAADQIPEIPSQEMIAEFPVPNPNQLPDVREEASLAAGDSFFVDPPSAEAGKIWSPSRFLSNDCE